MPTYEPKLLDALEALPTRNFTGHVWRHMFNDYPPTRINTSGARWNPPTVGAIYCALERDTALAEGQHLVDIQPRRTFAQRVLYELDAHITELVDLTGPDGLRSVGLTREDLLSDDYGACQRVGGAAAWLGRGGLLVPSARRDGDNLVVLIDAVGPDADLEVVAREVVEQRMP